MSKLVTSPVALEKYRSASRVWQGIPSVEVTRNGRIFVTFYSGGVREGLGNYCMVVMSKDGVSYSEPIAVAEVAGGRCFDPCLWIDPLGRLWFTWSQCPNDGCFASICNDPDAEELEWCEPFFIGNNIMMNKPTVLSTGEWLFPLAVWREGVRLPILPKEYDYQIPPRMSRVYKTVDSGKTFQMIGASDVDDRSFDEHQILEMTDGTLNMYVRTYYGIALSKSYDRGNHWTKGGDSGIMSPSSRFHIRRLPSGRILLINHVDFDGRNNLSALLSEDDGKTWPYKLLLDERQRVSYPDVALGPDGSIYVVYDRERGDAKNTLIEATSSAREILLAHITENEIIQGRLTCETSYLKRIVSKLGDYAGDNKNPFEETALFDPSTFTKYLMQMKSKDEMLWEVFKRFDENCDCMSADDSERMDSLIDRFMASPGVDASALLAILKHIMSHKDAENSTKHLTDEKLITTLNENLDKLFSLNDCAEMLGTSRYYLWYFVQNTCEITVDSLLKSMRLTRAQLLIREGARSNNEIALLCGFESEEHFLDMLERELGVSIDTYRKTII